MNDRKNPSGFERADVTFIRSKNGSVIDDCFKMLEAVKNPNNNCYFSLEAKNLEVGDYELYLRGEKDQKISVVVHAGEFLPNMESIMLKKNCLQEIVAGSRIVKI